MKKRVYRIYPAFIVTMFACVLVIAPLAGSSSPQGTVMHRILSFAIRTAGLLQPHCPGAFQSNPVPGVVNGSVWSIPFEFVCYIAVAILGVLGLLLRRSIPLLLGCGSLFVLILFAILQGLSKGSLGTWMSSSSYILGQFILHGSLIPMYLSGVVFYLYRHRILHGSLWAVISLIALIISSALPHGWNLCFPIAGAYLIFWFAFHPGIRLNHFGRYGDFSYGTYLYAFPIQQLAIRYYGVSINPWMLFLISTPLTLIVAILSWHCVEKWFVSRDKRKLRRPQDGPMRGASTAVL